MVSEPVYEGERPEGLYKRIYDFQGFEIQNRYNYERTPTGTLITMAFEERGRLAALWKLRKSFKVISHAARCHSIVMSIYRIRGIRKALRARDMRVPKNGLL